MGKRPSLSFSCAKFCRGSSREVDRTVQGEGLCVPGLQASGEQGHAQHHCSALCMSLPGPLQHTPQAEGLCSLPGPEAWNQGVSRPSSLKGFRSTPVLCLSPSFWHYQPSLASACLTLLCLQGPLIFSLCVSLHTSSLLEGHQSHWTHILQYDLILTSLHVQRTCFQVRSRSERPEVRTSIHLSGHTIQPPHPPILENLTASANSRLKC